MKEEDFKWIDPNVIPDAAHLLHHWNIWCVTNDKGEVLVYKDFSLQGNKNKIIAERLMSNIPGVIGVTLIPHVFLIDSPSRYY